MPWIEAWRRLQRERSDAISVDAGTARERDLGPKKMSDSYHRVVLPLGQDAWLSDTYINATGPDTVVPDSRDPSGTA